MRHRKTYSSTYTPVVHTTSFRSDRVHTLSTLIHANVPTCQRDAYYACLWRWKWAFSMVFFLMGGDDTDYKSTWSVNTVMAYYTLFYSSVILHWYHIITSPHTHKLSAQLAHKSQPHSSPCCLSPAHAECVMSRAWVRLRQILYCVGRSFSFWAPVLRQSTLQSFCLLSVRP